MSSQWEWACGVLGAGLKARGDLAPTVVSTRNGALLGGVTPLSLLSGRKHLIKASLSVDPP